MVQEFCRSFYGNYPCGVLTSACQQKSLYLTIMAEFIKKGIFL